MAEPNAPAQAAQPQPQPQPASSATYKPPTPPKAQNPVFKMMGLPNLPRKLPSRNWLIFWTISGAFASAIIYDKREKNRATAKWRRAVAPLAQETITSANQLPRKLTVYLESPPGDGLRAAQDHFIEYAKPILAASGLDWEFVQGRQQGDVRAAVAEKIRRSRRKHERASEEVTQTDEDIVDALRERMGVPEYEGAKGDVVIGRHTWKEYVRGLHEGWLGSLDAPPRPEPEVEPVPVEGEASEENKGGEEKKEEEKKEDKPERPPQLLPYNSPGDYSLASLPVQIPSEFSPSAPLAFPHRLGFRSTFVRLGRFLNRRKLANDIGREVAAVCFAASREWREADGEYEQQLVLQHEEKDWVKTVWKDDEEGKEKIWASPLAVDPRLMQRMRRFEMRPEDEARAREIKVPEEEIEGWIKGSLRSMWRWGVSAWNTKPMQPKVGNIDDE